MEQTDYGFLRKIRSTGRVSHRAGEPTYPVPSSTPDAVISHLREGTVSSTGDSVLARKESDRGTLSHVALPRILQSNLLGSQERRRLATGVRLKVSESLRTQGEIQDDHSPSSDKRITSWGLGRKCRFERRLLPHPHSPQVQTPAPFCHSRERRAPNFPIQSPSVRSDFGAQGIHESDATYRSSGTHTCGLPSAVSRRLDTEKYRQVTTGSANKLVATYHAPGRTGAKCAKVAVSTNPTLDTHRRRVLARCRTNVPADGQGSQDRKRSVSTSIRASDDSALLAVPPWAYELGNRCHPLGEIASQTPAALLARSLVPSIERYGGTDTSETQPTRSPSSLVVEQEVHASRNVSLGRLHLRPLQLYLLAHWSPASKDMAALIPVKHNLLDHHLHWWLNRKYTRAGMLLDIPEAQTQLFTDASKSGWGAHSDTFQASGEWSAREAILHINQLEMLAVRNALAAFKTHE